jgi:hypothetical protein
MRGTTMGSFADEIGRWNYTIETDTRHEHLNSGGIYTEEAKERVRRELLQLDGVYSDTLEWVPGHASKK